MSQAGMVRWADAKPVEMVPGLTRRTLAETADAQVVELRAHPGATVPLHDHPAQQVTYVISGQIDLTVDGVLYSLMPGDAYGIPGGVQHSAYFPVETMAVDTFSPPRAEYR